MELQHGVPLVVVLQRPYPPEVIRSLQAALKLLGARQARHGSDAYLERLREEVAAALAGMRTGE